MKISQVKNGDQVRLKNPLRIDHDPNWIYTVFGRGKIHAFIQNNNKDWPFCTSAHIDNLELIKKKIKINLNG